MEACSVEEGLTLLILRPSLSRTMEWRYTLVKGSFLVSCRPIITMRATQKNKMSEPEITPKRVSVAANVPITMKRHTGLEEGARVEVLHVRRLIRPAINQSARVRQGSRQEVRQSTHHPRVEKGKRPEENHVSSTSSSCVRMIFSLGTYERSQHGVENKALVSEWVACLAELGVGDLLGLLQRARHHPVLANVLLGCAFSMAER